MARIRKLGKAAFLVFLAVVLYLIAVNSGSGWLYVLAAGIVGVVAVSLVAPLWNTRNLEAVRHAPVVGKAGEPLKCRMEVRNTGLLARYLLEVRDEFAGSTGRGVVARVRRGAPEDFEYTVEAPQRGVYAGGDVVIESGAPFGLFYGTRRIRAASSVVIHPRTFDIAGLPRPSSESLAEADREQSETLHRGLGGEFWGVREYRSGDPARLIAWRQSARSLAAGRLSVVELARETDPPVSVSINLDPDAPFAACEMVVSAAASILLHAMKEGRQVTADAGPQRADFPEKPDPDGVLTWCAGLVAARPPKIEDASVEILPSLRGARPGGAGTVVLVSCAEFAGDGPWMTVAEERRMTDDLENAGRRAVRLGPDVREPWRIS